MDVGAFVQENKRWLLGCALGGVVWLIAGSVIDSVANPGKALQTPRQLGALAEVYTKEALAKAEAERDQLATARASLQQGLAFVPTKKYQLDGSVAHDMYGYQTGLALKQAIVAAAKERDVQCAETGIAWEVPTSPDDTRGMLFGLEVLDELQQRLFAAHDAVRTATPEALGLRAIVALKLDARRGQRAAVRAPRAGELDLRDLMVQEQVSFVVQADEATLLTFLESCRRPDRTLIVDSWQLLRPARRGEPCSAKGTVLGIQWKTADNKAEGSTSEGGK